MLVVHLCQLLFPHKHSLLFILDKPAFGKHDLQVVLQTDCKHVLAWDSSVKVFEAGAEYKFPNLFQFYKTPFLLKRRQVTKTRASAQVHRAAR